MIYNGRKYRDRFQELELDLSNKYSELLNAGNGQIDFLNPDTFDYQDYDEQDLEVTPMVEVRNDITGNIFDIHVMFVSNDGIYGAELDSPMSKDYYRFSDLADIKGRMSLLDEIQEVLS